MVADSESLKPEVSPQPRPENSQQLSETLKRKMSSQSEVTSLGPEAKRRRHHRRKPNKNRRVKDLMQHRPAGPNGPNGPIKESSKICQNPFRKPAGNGSQQPLLWRWKRKQKHPGNFGKNGGNHLGSGFSFAGHSGNSQSHRPQQGQGRKRPNLNLNNVVLRPTKVPLLNAPRNSTQFIIDDHESSDLVWNFETKSAPAKRSQPDAENR